MATDGDWQTAQERAKRERIKAFWDSQAELGEKAGTQDIILHQLEVEAIAKYIKDGDTVLDVGCGNGEAGEYLRNIYGRELDWWGIDYSDKMIEAARARLGKSMFLEVANILDFYAGMLDSKGRTDMIYTRFDVIYSKRCLINLASWEEQKQAIENICSLLKPGGIYAMCESSQDGLDWINQLRQAVGLAAIVPPFHNVYIQDKDIERLEVEGARLERIEEFSGLYYLASRVFNAAMAAEHGGIPDYNAGINRLALRLPNMGLRGQSRIWVWRKAG